MTEKELQSTPHDYKSAPKWAPDWVMDAIFYQIFPERFANGNPNNDPPNSVPWDAPPTRENFFGGDLEGVIQHLDYLQSLGITALYLTPIFAAHTNHKYDTVDYYQIDPHFGTMETFRHLLYEAHRRDIRLILDAVFNHVGEGFWAFRDVIEHNEESPYVNWFYIEELPISKEPTPNYQTFEGAYYLVKLNIHNPEVRQYLFDVARYWTQEGIDGWRLDVPYLMNHRFWKKFRQVVKAINPDLYIVAEVWEQATDWLQGDECDGAMNYRLRNLILDFFVHKKMDASVFDQALAVLRSEHPGESAYTMLNLLGSHDTPRFLTLCEGDLAKVKLASAFLFTYIGVPMIYYGDEVGMVGENDPDCRRTMRWDPATQNQELLFWYRQLIRIRKAHLALRRGKIRSLYAHGEVYAFERHHEMERVLIVFNLGETPETVLLSMGEERGADLLRDELTSQVFSLSQPIQLPEQSVLILTPIRGA